MPERNPFVIDLSWQIPIDADLWDNAEHYATEILHLLRDHGQEPKFESVEQWQNFVYRCAEYPQRLRNLIEKRKNNGH